MFAGSHFDRRRTPRERRGARRAPFVAAVRSSPSTTRAEREELALAVDLSERGMRLRRLLDAPAQGLVQLEFELPDGGAPILATGRLLGGDAHGSYRMSGVRFIDLDGDEAARIARYVADHV
jgi:hypothetical protein